MRLSSCLLLLHTGRLCPLLANHVAAALQSLGPSSKVLKGVSGSERPEQHQYLINNSYMFFYYVQVEERPERDFLDKVSIYIQTPTEMLDLIKREKIDISTLLPLQGCDRACVSLRAPEQLPPYQQPRWPRWAGLRPAGAAVIRHSLWRRRRPSGT